MCITCCQRLAKEEQWTPSFLYGLLEKDKSLVRDWSNKENNGCARHCGVLSFAWRRVGIFKLAGGGGGGEKEKEEEEKGF